MIYNKPRDYSWKKLPSLDLSFLSISKEKSSQKSDNLIKAPVTQSAVTEKNNVDIILSGTAPFVDELRVDDNTIIDLSAMPIIDGVPILKFPSEPLKADSLPTRQIIDINNSDDEQADASQTETVVTTIVTPEEKERNTQEELSVADKALHFFKIAAFFILLYTGAAIAFMLPLRPSYSESEKRDLAKFPEFSFQKLASGDYFGEIDTWFSDTFPFRDPLTQFDGQFKKLFGISTVQIHGEVDTGDEIPDIPIDIPDAIAPIPGVSEENKEPPKKPRPNVNLQDLGAVVVAGDSAYEYYNFSQDLGVRYITAVSTIKSKANPKNNVFCMVVPTSMDIVLDDTLRSEITSSDQKKALDFFNSSIKNTVNVDTLYATERAHRDEYIYFRTDHHWTALGAYYAYEDLCKKQGITPIPLSKYETVTYDNFTGTFYTNASQSSTLKENADSVVTYTPLNNNTCTITDKNGAKFQLDVVRDVTDFGSTLKYLTFIGGDNPLTVIENHDNPNGKTCLIIKDSYANALVPFLIPHYSNIYIIDPRHYNGSLAEFSKDKVIDDVIFISNISTTRNEYFIESLEYLVR